VTDLDVELDQLQAPALPCLSCMHGYPQHRDAGGHCGARIGGGAAGAGGIVVPCPCAGFRWVDPGGPPVGSYLDPPTTPAM
jgi:hypothetical protein